MSRSQSQYQFATVPAAEIQRSHFDRSHPYMSTFDAGWLVPIYVDEVLPGDTFNLKLNAFGRLATPIKPVMDNMYLDTFFSLSPHGFYGVTLRGLWESVSTPLTQLIILCLKLLLLIMRVVV